MELNASVAIPLRRAASSYSFSSPSLATLCFTLTHLQCQPQDCLVVVVVLLLVVMASHSSTKQSATQKVCLRVEKQGKGGWGGRSGQEEGLIFIVPAPPRHRPRKHKACTISDTIRGPQSLGGLRGFTSLCLNHAPPNSSPLSLPPAPRTPRCVLKAHVCLLLSFALFFLRTRPQPYRQHR